MVVLDKEGRIAAHTRAGGARASAPDEPDLAARGRARAVVTVERGRDGAGRSGRPPARGLEIVVPVYIDEGSAEKWGTVRVRLLHRGVHRRIRVHAPRRCSALGLLALAVGVLGSFLMARRITKPLSGLVAGTLRAARGDLESPHRGPHGRRDRGAGAAASTT